MYNRGFMKNIVEQEIDFKRNRYRILLILTGLMFVVMLFFTIIYFVDYNKKYGYFEKIVATVVEYVGSTPFAISSVTG